ncbi:hypothetical protein AB1Y20_006516 [Prymnesium parvum]|uniref:Uncharacterized protein n=1 Tax=Prymnesium parvum TaxID=97485 RepID=A0AB34J0V7_PRYPA
MVLRRNISMPSTPTTSGLPQGRRQFSGGGSLFMSTATPARSQPSSSSVSPCRARSTCDMASLTEAVMRLEQKDAERDEARKSNRSQVDKLRALLHENQNGLAALQDRVENMCDDYGNELNARKRYNEMRSDLENALTEVSTLRAHATATAATIERMEEVQRESLLVKQEVGVLRGEQIELQRALRESDARVVEQASIIAALRNTVASVEQRQTALVTSTAEAQARLGREISESKSDFRDVVEMLETDLKQLRAEVASALQGKDAVRQVQLELQEQREQLEQQRQRLQAEQGVHHDELASQLQALYEHIERSEHEEIRRREERERRRTSEDARTTALQASVDALHAAVDELRQTVKGFDTVFATVGALEYSARGSEDCGNTILAAVPTDVSLLRIPTSNGTRNAHNAGLACSLSGATFRFYATATAS